MKLNLFTLIKPQNILATDYSISGPGIQVDSSTDATPQLEKIISNVIGFLTIIAVIFFVIQIILAGYSFISGQGDPKKIEMSRKKLTDSILGLTIVVVAFGATAFISTLLGLGDVFNLSTFVNSIKP
jgi:hypothetical protein